jgi:hypothetical protein
LTATGTKVDSANRVAAQTTATAVWKDDRLAAHRAQLRRRAFVVAGLADAAALEVGDLVGADDDGVGVARRDRFGLREREPRCGLRRRLAYPRVLVDPGGLDIEGQAQPRQQLAR